MKKIVLFVVSALALMFVLSHLPSARALPPGVHPNPTPVPSASGAPVSN